MFTINIYLKLALIVLFLGGGIVLWMIYGFGFAWLFLLAGLLLLASYLFLGTLNSTAKLMEAGDIDGAEKRLKMTIAPNLLLSAMRPNYKILQGSFASQRGDEQEAQKYFNEALAMDLKTDDEKAMVLIQLASIRAKKGNITGAKKYLNDLKKLKVTMTQTKDQIEYIDMAVKQMEASKKASLGRGGKRGGMMQPGGKRRRPKMR